MESRYCVKEEVAASQFFLDTDNTGVDDDANAGGRHFQLDACFLCKRDMASDRHLFMYRGDAAFCSEDCRQEQVDMDAVLAAPPVAHDATARSSGRRRRRRRRPPRTPSCPPR
jgi:hypothetical protein